MANLQTFFVLNALDAAQLQDATAGRPDRLEPRKIEFGQYKNQYAIPARVARDPAFADLAAAFAVMAEVGLDIEEVWPVGEE